MSWETVLPYLVSFGIGIGLTIIVQRLRSPAPLPNSDHHHAAFTYGSDAIILLDELNRIIDLNPAAEYALGLTQIEIVGQPAQAAFAAWSGAVDDYLEKGHIDTEISTTDHSETFHFDLKIVPLSSDRGRLTGRLIVLHDITARKQIEQQLASHRRQLENLVVQRTATLIEANASLQTEIAERKLAEVTLRASEARYRSLVENAPVPIFVQQAGRFVYLNATANTLFGTPAASNLIGHVLLHYVHPEDIKRFQKRILNATADSGNTGEVDVRIIRPDGTVITLELTAIITEFEHETSQLIIGLDITDRTRAADAIWQYAERLSILHEVDRAILTAETPENVADAMLGRLLSLMASQTATVALFDLERQRATILASKSATPLSITPGITYALRHWPGFAQLAQSTTHQCDDLAAIGQPGPVERMLLEHGIRSHINVPLSSMGMLIGVLQLGATKPDTFTNQRIEIAGEVADQLAIALQHARLNEQIQRHTEDLEARVSQRTAELEIANEQLRELSRVKDEFVSNVSHELRTPITNMKLHLDLLERLPDKRERYLSTLNHETDRLGTLIESLLTLSRMDQARLEFELQPVDVNQLAGDLVADRVTLADAEDLTLSFEPQLDIAPVLADFGLLGQVLSILLTNALHYTPAGGCVTVRAQRHPTETQWAGFAVSDTGPGILPEEQPKLFSRFFRGSAGENSGVSGTGLGLSIAKEIIERHNGRIEVKSEGIPGEGTTFHVWVPVCESV